MRRIAVVLVLAACAGKGKKTLPPPDAAGGVATPRPSADGGVPGYHVIEIQQPATLTLALPPLPGPTSPQVVQQSPHEPDPCTLPPDASFAYLEVGEGAAATPPGSPPVLAVRCGHLVPRALVVAPASAPLILASRDDARHVLDLEPPSGPPRRIPLPLRGSRVTVSLPVGFTRIACELHPDEVAHVLVSEHPYATVVSGDSVRFDNLPPPARSYDVVIAHVGAQGAPALLRRSARSVVGEATEPAAGAPADEPPQAP